MTKPLFKIHVYSLVKSTDESKEVDFSKFCDLAESLSGQQRSSTLLISDSYRKYLFSIDSEFNSLQEVKEQAKEYLTEYRLVLITDSIGNIFYIHS